MELLLAARVLPQMAVRPSDVSPRLEILSRISSDVRRGSASQWQASRTRVLPILTQASSNGENQVDMVSAQVEVPTNVRVAIINDTVSSSITRGVPRKASRGDALLTSVIYCPTRHGGEGALTAVRGRRREVSHAVQLEGFVAGRSSCKDARDR